MSLYDDAIRARIRHGERIRDILSREPGVSRLDATEDADRVLKQARSTGAAIAVPIFGQLYVEACLAERRAAALLEVVVSQHVAWQWLSGISGIGPVVAGRLLARLDVRRAATPASFWAYCGLATVPGTSYRCRACGQFITSSPGLRETPAHQLGNGRACVGSAADPVPGGDVRVAKPRPRRGESRSYDATARHACYLIGVSFARKGIRYKMIFREHLELVERRHPEWPKKRAQLAAQRATVKRFLVDLWVEWRALEGLPIVQPQHHTKEALHRSRGSGDSA